VAREACAVEDILGGKAMLIRIYQMLTRLVQRYDSGGSVAEEEAQYRSGAGDEREADQATGSGTEDDDEDEDEDDDEDD